MPRRTRAFLGYFGSCEEIMKENKGILNVSQTELEKAFKAPVKTNTTVYSEPLDPEQDAIDQMGEAILTNLLGS